MDFHEIDWNQQYREHHVPFGKLPAGSDESREFWDAKAPSFAHKPRRSDYISQLIKIMALAPQQSVFDMGCGSGTLAIPLASAGHYVVSVDFSGGMLAELERTAALRGVIDNVEIHRRSWQESWDDLPVCDVAVSSRSFIIDDLAEGIAKLESRARDGVVLTCGAGDLPYRDSRMLEALGRADQAAMFPTDLVITANYLFSIGRLPSISYIEYPARWARKTREILVADLRETCGPLNADEERLFDEFCGKHVTYLKDEDAWALDYPRLDRWAALKWDVPTNGGL